MNPAAKLPTSPGFYWWRENPVQDWEMVQIVNTSAGLPGGPNLNTYAVESHKWSGRTLSQWYGSYPIGEWISCPRPISTDTTASTPADNNHSLQPEPFARSWTPSCREEVISALWFIVAGIAHLGGCSPWLFWIIMAKAISDSIHSVRLAVSQWSKNSQAD